MPKPVFDRQAYMVEYLRKRREDRTAALNEIKLGAGCADCGYAEHPAALDFHHLDPATKAIKGSFAKNKTRSWKFLEEEIAKCIVLCSNCHRVRENTDA